MLYDLLTSDTGAALVLGLVGLVFAGLKRLETVQAYELERALDCIRLGVEETYQNYVRALKQSREDGKLTAEERAAARAMAVNAALQYARDQGIPLLKTYALEYLPVLVEKVLRQSKAEAAAAVPFSWASSDGPELPSPSALLTETPG